MEKKKKRNQEENNAKKETETLTQVDVDPVAADRISESISEGFVNGDLEGF